MATLAGAGAVLEEVFPASAGGEVDTAIQAGTQEAGAVIRAAEVAVTRADVGAMMIRLTPASHRR